MSKLGGVLQTADYGPYVEERQECRWHPGKSGLLSNPQPMPVPVIGFQRVPSNEDSMADYLVKYGPLSAGK